MKRDPRVTAYIQRSAPFARPILKRLRARVHTAGNLEEDLKWGMPTFLHRGKIVCGMGSFKAHCALWFWKGTKIVGRKPKEAMGHFGRITTVKELPSAAALKTYVKKSMRLIDEQHARKARPAR